MLQSTGGADTAIKYLKKVGRNVFALDTEWAVWWEEGVAHKDDINVIQICALGDRSSRLYLCSILLSAIRASTPSFCSMLG